MSTVTQTDQIAFQEVLDRLRRSRNENEGERGQITNLYTLGYVIGELWAKCEAAAWELEELEATIEELESLYDRRIPIEVLEERQRNAHGSSAYDPKSFGNADVDPIIIAVKSFPQHRDQSDPDDPDYVEGFVDGALNLWSKAKPHL